MFVELSEDQDFFRQTTARFLDDLVPVTEVKRLRHDPAGFDADYWRRGAQLGWTSMLVGEDHGGGSVSGRPVVDLSLVAYEFGRHAAPGPLFASNIVAYALSRAANPAHAAVLSELLSGEQVATWCYSEPFPNDRLRKVGLEIRAEGDELVMNGAKRPVEFAAQSSQLLVTGRCEDGLTQVLVPSRAPGVSIEPMQSVDLTRRFAVVSFDDVKVRRDFAVGRTGEAGPEVERQLQLCMVLVCAESAGAMQSAFDMTVEWAFDRYSFGRPLASYQALKHRFADMKTWLEASHAIGDAAAEALQDDSPQAGELAAAAKAFVGDYGTELAQNCVQLHGGIGVTFEHDLHLFLRRLTINRALYGTPSEHREHLGRSLLRQEAA